MKYSFAIAILGAAIVLGGCTPSTPADSTTASTAPKAKSAMPATPTPTAAPAAASTDAAAAPAAGDDKFFDATVLTDKKDDDNSADAKDTFTKDTEIINIHGTFDLNGKAAKLKAVWICDKSDNPSVPANYKIDEKEMDANPPINSADFSLTKPTAGWPLGDYHVELYKDGAKVASVSFKVQ